MLEGQSSHTSWLSGDKLYVVLKLPVEALANMLFSVEMDEVPLYGYFLQRYYPRVQ